MSVGQQGRGKKYSRPLTPIECAEYIQEIKNETGESDHDISKRLQLGKPKSGSGKILNDIDIEKPDPSQVQSFLRLLKISKKSVHLIGFKGDPHPVKFSTATKVYKFEPEIQDKLLQSVQKYNFTRDDVLDILQYMKKHDTSVDESIQVIKNLKPESVLQYMISYIVPSSVHSFLSSINSVDEVREHVFKKFQENLSGVIESVIVEGNLMVITMDESSYKSFEQKMKEKDLTYNEYIERIIVGEKNV